MRIGWRIPLPGPFSVGGTVWRSKPRPKSAMTAGHVNREHRRFNAAICPDSAGLGGQTAQQIRAAGCRLALRRVLRPDAHDVQPPLYDCAAPERRGSVRQARQVVTGPAVP